MGKPPRKPCKTCEERRRKLALLAKTVASKLKPKKVNK